MKYLTQVLSSYKTFCSFLLFTLGKVKIKQKEFRASFHMHKNTTILKVGMKNVNYDISFFLCIITI